MRPPDTRYAQILTAGRTGSTYLATFLAQNFPEVEVAQEREPSRALRILNNVGTLSGGTFSRLMLSFTTRCYKQSRTRWLEKSSAPLLVEVNPFIGEMGAALSTVETAAVIHVVRHPVAWVRSSIGFGSYGWRRPIVPYLPFVRERPSLGHSDWSKWSISQKFAWRWVRRNAAIRQHLECLEIPTIVLRYEDIFEGQQFSRDAAADMVRLFELPPARLDSIAFDHSLRNPTLTKHQGDKFTADDDQITAICEAEANHYGYSATVPG